MKKSKINFFPVGDLNDTSSMAEIKIQYFDSE